MENYDFNEEFQEKILALMIQDKTFLNEYGSLIEAAYFRHEEYQNIALCCLEHLNSYGCAIDVPSLRVRLKVMVGKNIIEEDELELYNDCITELLKIDIVDASFVKDQILEFAKNRAMLLVLRQSQEYYKQGDIDKILPAMIEASSVSRESDKEIELFTQYKELVQYKRKSADRPIPTGIPLLDAALRGGLYKEQLGMLLGAVSRGKSMALVHFGMVATALGFNVCHITNEMSVYKVSDRYATIFADIKYEDLFEIKGDIGDELLAFGEQLGCKLWIKKFAPGIHTIYDYKAFIDLLINKGNHIDLLLIDHLNDVGSHINHKEIWAQKEQTAVVMRGLTEEFKLPVWTAMHPKQEDANKEWLDAYSASGSKRIIEIVDICVTLNADEEERESGRMRLELVKHRDGKSNVRIVINQNYSKIKFFDGERK